jgi:hypothetical protein
MHTLMLVAGGLVALGLFVLIAILLKRSPADGARYFVLPWLVASLVNLYLGVSRAGIPVTTEILVLIVVFGVPAAVAWFITHRFGP